MSKWQDRVINHPVMTTLESLRGVLESAQAIDVPASSVEDIERLKQAFGYVAQSVNGIDANIVPPGILNNIEKHLQNCFNEFSAFASNKNQGHLDNANTHIDSALTHAFQLPAPMPLEQVDSLKEAVTSFRRSAGQLLASLERDKDRLANDIQASKGRVEELASEIAAQKARVDSVISDQQQQFSASESARREEFAKSQVDATTEVKAAIEERRASLDALEEDVTEKFNVFAESSKAEFKTLLGQSNEAAKAHIEELITYRDQAQKLMHVIGSTGMAGEFQKAATSAKWSVRFWQLLAVGSMSGLIWFAIAAYQAAGDSDQGLAMIGSRIFVAVAFGILAVFSVRQADRYHEAETRNRRYQLELSSLEPYLAGLPEDVRNEVKVKLAEKFFGNPEQPALQGAAKASGNALDLVRMALETAQEALKKGG